MDASDDLDVAADVATAASQGRKGRWPSHPRAVPPGEVATDWHPRSSESLPIDDIDRLFQAAGEKIKNSDLKRLAPEAVNSGKAAAGALLPVEDAPMQAASNGGFRILRVRPK